MSKWQGDGAGGDEASCMLSQLRRASIELAHGVLELMKQLYDQMSQKKIFLRNLSASYTTAGAYDHGAEAPCPKCAIGGYPTGRISSTHSSTKHKSNFRNK